MRAQGPKNRTEWENEVDRPIKKPAKVRSQKPLPGQMSLFDDKEERERAPTEDEQE